MFNKTGMVTMMLARELISHSPGDRIDTIASYTEQLDTSRGVVQEALNFLENEKTFVRAKRGTLGTFLTEIDYKKLWEFTSWGILSGVSPLPYTKKHEGIATAIYDEMEKRDIPFHFAYMQGAEKRIHGVIEDKYDFAVLGKEAAIRLGEKYENLSIVMQFAPYSYLSGYVVLYKDKSVLNRNKLRVGRDMDSPDHTKWMESLREDTDKEIEYVDMQYTKMIPAILDGIIDVTIYNKDTVEKPEIFGNIRFEDLKINKDIGEQTRAVLVINSKSYGIANLLKQIINEERVDKIQEEVRAGTRVPVY
jgi:ABC-type phosphate/phosphonate transport system substrate-binding protein